MWYNLPILANFYQIIAEIQALLRSEELCQDYFKVFIHVVICSPFIFHIACLIYEKDSYKYSQAYKKA